MYNVTKIILLIFAMVTAFCNCSGGKMDEKGKIFTSIKDVPVSTWKNLGEKRVYFGHQSVGKNIIDGVQDVIKQNTHIKLNIVETSDPEAFNKALFAHFKLGKNEDPKSKCDAFANFMNKIGNKVDIAFFKFCFVDITSSTDIDKLFSDYKETISRLKEKYPKTTFVHVTVPLMTVQSGLKAWIKQIIGRPVGGYDDNVRRGDFNEKLRAEYFGKDPIYDLAGIESTLPDGSKASFKKGGKVYESMAPEYTDDGGHLNEKGRRLAGEQLLTLLANLAQ